MKRSGFILCFILSIAASYGQEELEKELPNIILFYADDLGWMDLSVQGSPYYETPNIDRLASQGMLLTQAYANAANCAPSRACLITGLYGPRHGIFTVGSSARGKTEQRKLIPVENRTVLDTSFTTMPQYLKSAGYKTCMAGKWHLSEDPKPYGFDASFGGGKIGFPRSYFSPYSNPKLHPPGAPCQSVPFCRFKNRRFVAALACAPDSHCS